MVTIQKPFGFNYHAMVTSIFCFPHYFNPPISPPTIFGVTWSVIKVKAIGVPILGYKLKTILNQYHRSKLDKMTDYKIMKKNGYF